jgi:hypothetical protein
MKPPYALIFFAALSVLVFEVCLVRVFSIRFSYHYASLVVSISMMGLVFGGLCAYVGRCGRITNRPFLTATGLCLSFPLCFLLSSMVPFDYYRIIWEKKEMAYLFVIFLVLAIPFFFYGLMLSNLLAAFPVRANKVYGSDLFGAAAGALGSLFLLEYAAIEQIIVIISSVLAVALAVQKPRRPWRIAVLPFALIASIPLMAGSKFTAISPYKGLMQALRDDGAQLLETVHSSHSRLDVFENRKMKLAPGLSLAYDEAIPKGLGIALDGDLAGVFADETDPASLGFLPFMASALPYRLDHRRRVLVVGLTNNLNLLLARRFGVEALFVTERDRSINKYVKEEGSTMALSRKSLRPLSGRVFLRDLEEKLDCIVLSRAGFVTSGTFGLQEDYDTTVEAFVQYLSSLKDSGLLFVQVFLAPPARQELRLMNTIGRALETVNVPNVADHLFVFRTWDTMNFLVKRTPFTTQERLASMKFCRARQFEVVYPDLEKRDLFIEGTDYRGLFLQMAGRESGRLFMEKYLFDIRPTTDDRPFAHYYLKLTAIKELYRLAGRKWLYFLYEGMAIPFVLLFLALMAAATLVPALRRITRQDTAGRRTRTALTTLYFASLGLGFMFTEMYFVHRLILPLGSPVNALVATLVLLLLSSGAGSLLSAHVRATIPGFMLWGLPAMLLSCQFLPASAFLSPYSLLTLLPIGIFLGMFFPLGLRALHRGEDAMIPLYYAVNGGASIVAPPLASMIAVTYGCRWLLITASILYAGCLFLLSLPGHGHKGNAP